MAVKSSFGFFFSSTPKITPYSPRCSKLKPPRGKITGFSCSGLRYDDDDDDKRKAPIKRSHGESFCCICGRRRFIEGTTATSTALAVFPNGPSNASDLHSDDDYRSVLNKVRPPRTDWYEEFQASFLDKFKDSYEAEIADYKSQLFSNLKGKAQKVLEIGIGTGPNLKYYASEADVQVFGMDPNRKMEKYAQAAAEAAGLPLANFEFLHAVGEAIPLGDASVDAVVGTLVLCSVKDVDMALKEVKRVLRPGGIYLFVEHVAAKDGTLLRFIQNVLDPLQQTVADGCHLTRETGMKISEAGFSGVELNKAFLSNAFYVNPQVYGIASKQHQE